jgi:endonuclease III
VEGQFLKNERVPKPRCGSLRLQEFIDKFGQLYSEMLGLDLKSRNNGETTKWFLASILYGKPIREVSATTTYHVFEKNGILTPEKIRKAGWEKLVELLDEGGYTRYDFSTADRLLEIFGNLEKDYGGDFDRLYRSATGQKDLEQKLKDLGRGIGDTTVSIFLRDMRIIWPKAKPAPSPLVKLAMRDLKIKRLERFAKEKHLDIIKLETALLRYGKDFLRRGEHLEIDMKKRK